MKKVVMDSDAREVINKAIRILGDTVASTLGPMGNNVLISSDVASPYVTNDGATIASALASDDTSVDAVLQIAKESSLKTNEMVGDGTTSTIVLMQAILEGAFSSLENCVVIKRCLEEHLDEISKLIDRVKKTPNKNDYLRVAKMSCGDDELGTTLSELFYKIGSRKAINLEASNNGQTYYEIKNGYSLDIDSPVVYFKNKDVIDLSDVHVAVVKGYLDSLESISEIINEGLDGKNIIILCDEYDNNLFEEVVLYHLNYSKNIFLFKIPDYGSRKESIISDICELSGSLLKNINYEPISISDMGFLDKVFIRKDELVFFSDKKNINYINLLKKEYKNTYSSYEREFLESRIAKLEGNVATFYVGGATKSEIHEKMMRAEDALWALEMAKDGVVIGEGITYLKIASLLNGDDLGTKILKQALEKPFDMIFKNAGLDSSEIKKQIVQSGFKKAYNFNTNKLEETTDIVDPALVVLQTIKNAISISNLLMTTNYLVINHMDNKQIEEI